MYRITTKLVNKKEFNSKLFSRKEINKTISAAAMDDNDEYFVI